MIQMHTHPVISRLVLLCHCFVFRFELGINIRPPSTQFLGYVPNTKFWVQGFYLAAFVIAEPKKCWPETQMLEIQIMFISNLHRIVPQIMSDQHWHVQLSAAQFQNQATGCSCCIALPPPRMSMQRPSCIWSLILDESFFKWTTRRAQKVETHHV
jgi:hypothetical protein